MLTREKQDILDLLGYRCSNDDIPGSQTANALQQFRSEHGAAYSGGISDEQALIKAVHEWEPSSTFDDLVSSIPETEDSFWASIRYFRREEFRCPCGKCGGFPVEPQKELVLTADDLRADVNSKMIIVPPDGHSGGSGVRCPPYNATFPNSVSNSRHLDGKAIDFSAPDTDSSVVESTLERYRNEKRIRYWYRISPGSWHMDIP